VRIEIIHGWRYDPQSAVALQRELKERVITRGRPRRVRCVAGVDLAAGRGQNDARGAVVLLDYPGLNLVEKSVVGGRLDFPYVPGLLSFREMPLLLRACAALRHRPDLVLVDGQGLAHPRRLGLACHLGLFLKVPTIGCAKSRLCGEAEMPGDERGDYRDLTADGEIIGAVLRTRRGVKPLWVSAGHLISLAAAREWVLNCGRGYRLPEPTRLAHLAAAGNL